MAAEEHGSLAVCAAEHEVPGRAGQQPAMASRTCSQCCSMHSAMLGSTGLTHTRFGCRKRLHVDRLRSGAAPAPSAAAAVARSHDSCSTLRPTEQLTGSAIVNRDVWCHHVDGGVGQQTTWQWVQQSVGRSIARELAAYPTAIDTFQQRFGPSCILFRQHSWSAVSFTMVSLPPLPCA